MIEAAAISALYAIVVEVFVHRELNLRAICRVSSLRCATLLGGVFAIIGVAMGLTNYLVDAMVPMKLVAWVGAHVESRLVFLLMLNALLLLVGCVMDIFSAIFVVLPLIIPASQLFDVDPLHLGMIFLLNLEIGYLDAPGRHEPVSRLVPTRKAHRRNLSQRSAVSRRADRRVAADHVYSVAGSRSEIATCRTELRTFVQGLSNVARLDSPPR